MQGYLSATGALFPYMLRRRSRLSSLERKRNTLPGHRKWASIAGANSKSRREDDRADRSSADGNPLTDKRRPPGSSDRATDPPVGLAWSGAPGTCRAGCDFPEVPFPPRMSETQTSGSRDRDGGLPPRQENRSRAKTCRNPRMTTTTCQAPVGRCVGVRQTSRVGVQSALGSDSRYEISMPRLRWT